MSDIGYALFDTALGRCALAWRARGLVRVLLPDVDDAALRRSVTTRHAEAQEAPPPQDVAAAVVAIQALMRGQESDLAAIVLDFEGLADLDRRVYEIARRVPPGATRTYGEIARELGGNQWSREVGQSLGRNPWPIVVPCHRVMGADGRLVGFSAPGGVETKLRLLEIERRLAGAPPSLFGDDPAFKLAVKPRR
jgi:methylated-DNA-[protein]-cysteine S-methyltransferase